MGQGQWHCYNGLQLDRLVSLCLTELEIDLLRVQRFW
jgi:hypothetical protein